MSTKNMSEHFDLREVYMSEIEPLVQQIHEKCLEYRLPYVASYCFSNDESTMGVHNAAGFFGIERTPTSMVLAEKILESSESNPRVAFLSPRLDTLSEESAE